MMAHFLAGRFRFAILLVATACLSMMLANILTLNFTILCMTEHTHHWRTFTLDLGFDVFEKVDFERREGENTVHSQIPTETTPPPGPWRPPLPDIPVPGIQMPTPGFNWASFKLARHNPQLFIRLIKTVAFEAAKLAAKRVGQRMDPRNVDFAQFRHGFNLTNYDANVLSSLREHMLRKIGQSNDLLEKIQANASPWENIRPEQIELHNITWDGQVHGRVKVITEAAEYDYTSRQKALLFGVIAVGALLTIPIVSVAIDKFGCRKTFTLVGLVSTISTALCPPAATLGFYPFLVARLVQGVGFAACFPVIGAVTSAWACLTENGLFNGALTSFIQLAPVIAMPLSGVLCATIGWHFSFYIYAGITLVLTALWWFIYRDTASEHHMVSNMELRQIQFGKIVDGWSKHNKFLFKAICTDVSVWAIWVAAVGNMYSIQMMVMFSPTYIREILHYTIMNVGFAAAIPTLMQFCVKMAAGIISDRLKIGETFKVRLFNSIAFCGMATFMLALAFTPTEHYRLSLLFIVLCVTMLGFNTGGLFKSATLIGRHYAYFIGAKIQVIMCIAMLTVPLFVYAMTPNNTPGEWSLVFISHAILLLVANAIFCLIGSGKAASFTQSNSVDQPQMNGAIGTAADLEEQTKPIMATGKEGNGYNGNGTMPKMQNGTTMANGTNGHAASNGMTNGQSQKNESNGGNDDIAA